jgi:hypothetical protein
LNAIKKRFAGFCRHFFRAEEMEKKYHTVMIGPNRNVAKHAMGTTISRTTSKIASHLPAHPGKQAGHRRLWIESHEKHEKACG